MRTSIAKVIFLFSISIFPILVNAGTLTINGSTSSTISIYPGQQINISYTGAGDMVTIKPKRPMSGMSGDFCADFLLQSDVYYPATINDAITNNQNLLFAALECSTVMFFETYNIFNEDTSYIETLTITFILAQPPTSVPTMSQWGTALFSLLILLLGLITVYNIQRQGIPTTVRGITFGQWILPFDRALYGAGLKSATIGSIVGFTLILVIWQEITFADVWGMSIGVAISAYGWHLYKLLQNEKEKRLSDF